MDATKDSILFDPRDEVFTDTQRPQKCWYTIEPPCKHEKVEQPATYKSILLAKTGIPDNQMSEIAFYRNRAFRAEAEIKKLKNKLKEKGIPY